MTGSYADFKKRILILTEIDLDGYKESQMKRRIDALIERSGALSYEEYCGLLISDKKRFEEFVNFITINVSEFWRNPEQWQILEEKILPEFAGKGNVKIWSAACSTGDEAYSLSMLFMKHNEIENFSVLASDIDKNVLKTAKKGIYGIRNLGGLPEEYLKRYFSRVEEDSYCISEEVKKNVIFRCQDLLKSEYPAGCDLIVCRNVLIYFTEEAQKNIYRGFNNSLKTGGFLFLGNTEQILEPAEFGFQPVSSFFYEKVSNLY